jgi:hypothetical protein
VASAWNADVGSSGMVLRDVDGWTLGFAGGADEPMVRDVDLAERLGFERPRKIRELIERHIDAGNLNDSEVRPAMGQTSPQGGRPGTEYWLTEAGALFIATQSGTKRAVGISKEMVRVFMTWRRGLLAPESSAPVLSRDELTNIVRSIARETVDAAMVHAIGYHNGEVVGPAGGREIRTALREYAAAMARPKDAASAKSWRSSGDVELRGRVEFSGSGSSWDRLPFSKFAVARKTLDGMLARAEKVRGERSRGSQASLFGTLKKAS